MQKNPIRKTHKNRLLASLPALVIEQLDPHLSPVDLPGIELFTTPANRSIPCIFLKMVFVHLWRQWQTELPSRWEL